MSPQISTPIHFENELKERKAQVIERIKDVRTAQRAFRAEYQRYAEDFDELERFLHANPTEDATSSNSVTFPIPTTSLSWKPDLPRHPLIVPALS